MNRNQKFGNTVVVLLKVMRVVSIRTLYTTNNSLTLVKILNKRSLYFTGQYDFAMIKQLNIGLLRYYL